MKALKTKKGEIKLPCMEPVIVPIDKVVANDYNPNNVPKDKMELLEESIMQNGFCFPVVTIYDPSDDVYVIVDGFHRYTIFKDYLEAEELPVVVLDLDIIHRMAATIQFNKARGVHGTELMGELVIKLVKQGCTDDKIAQLLGMELEEVFRLKQITGIADVFKNQVFSRAWEMLEVEE